MTTVMWKMENLLRRMKQTDLVGDAERDSAALAARAEAPDSGEVPGQYAGVDAGAETGRPIRFGSEQRAFARTVAPVDFANQGQTSVDLIGARQAEKRHVILRERADIPRGGDRR